MAIQSGVRYCGHNYFGATDDWNLLGTDGARFWYATVDFPEAYEEVPSVIVMLKNFHVMKGEPRIEIGVEDVTVSSFGLTIHVWGDTQLVGAGVQWMSYD